MQRKMKHILSAKHISEVRFLLVRLRWKALNPGKGVCDIAQKLAKTVFYDHSEYLDNSI